MIHDERHILRMPEQNFEEIAAPLPVDSPIPKDVKGDDERLMRGGDDRPLHAVPARPAVVIGGKVAVLTAMETFP